MIRVPIASDGWRFIILFGAAGAFLLWLDRWWSVPWGVVGIGLAVFSIYFFRDLDRATTIDPGAIYSPGDGKVMEVAILADGEHAGKMIIRIFLSVFDGHIQRSPVKGTVTNIAYKKGLFLDARDPKAHVDNEQNSITLETPKGTVVVKQIAGLIARRIVCWVSRGTTLQQGERYGLIRFGSQVDVILPGNSQPMVRAGARVIGGETVLARWGR